MRKVILLVAINIIVTLTFASAQVVYYSNRGSSPQQFIYMDGKGNYTGTSIQTGNTVEYLDANGNLAGIANTTPLPLDTPSVGGDE